MDKALVDAMIAEIDQRLSRAGQRDPPPPGVPEARVRVARAQVPRRPHGLPREHQGRAAQRLQGGSARRLRGRARGRRSPASTGSSTRTSTASFGGKPYGADRAPTTTSARARRTSRCCSKCAAVAAMAHAPFIANAGPEFFGEKNFLDLPEPQGPQVPLRGPAVRAVALVPRERGRALRRPVHAALPAAPALRREDRPGEGLQLQRGRRRPARRATCWGNASTAFATPRRGLVRQVPLVPEHHRPAGRRRGREPAAAPVRGDGRDPDQDPDRGACSPSAASTSCPRRASSA